MTEESKPVEEEAARKRAIDAAFEDAAPPKKEEESNGSSTADEPAKNDATATDAAKAEETKTEPTPDIVPRGNPLRTKRGLVGILGGGIPAYLLMAKNGQNAWGVPLGFVCVLVMAWGVMDLLGTFDDPEERVASRTTLGALASPLV
ncbi:MAG TPA: glycosyltransferase family 39 protein, partial [Labilithrix sp.]